MDPITPFILNRMLSATRGAAESEGGRRIVTANLGVKLLAGLFPAFPLGALVMVLIYGDDGAPVLIYSLIGGFMLLAGALVYMVLLTRLEFDDNYIHFSSPLYRDRRIPWSSVTRGWYSAPLTTFYVDTTEIGKIRVSPMQHGWVDFLRMAGNRMKEYRGEDPFEGLLPEV